MASEEQKKDLQTKITIVVMAAVVVTAVYLIGPGLERFVDYARKNKTQAWAPKWYYNVARIYEATWRKPKAERVYEEFWTLWSGDESKLDFATVQEEVRYEVDYPSLVPRWAAKYPNGRPEWVGGPGAKPDPLMADVLMRLCKIHEDNRDYVNARWYYRCVLVNFPPGTPAYIQAEQAYKRDVSRSF